MRMATPLLLAALALVACTGSPQAVPTAVVSPSASPAATQAPVATASPVPTASPAATALPTASPAAPTAVSFKTDVVPILRARCIQCHKPGGIAPSNYQYFDASGNPQHAVVQAKIGEMVAAIKAGRMPLNAPGSLSAAEIATLEAYRDAGAPDN